MLGDQIIVKMLDGNALPPFLRISNSYINVETYSKGDIGNYTI